MKNLRLNALFVPLFSMSAAGFIFFAIGLPLVLKLEGFDYAMIGKFQLVNLPVAFKFLLSPAVECVKFSKNHYKIWTLISGLIYAVSFVLLTFADIKNEPNLLFWLCFLCVLAASLADAPINALAINVFKADERKAAGAFKTTAYFIAGILGGGVFVIIYNHLGWRNLCFIVAALVAGCLCALFFIKESGETAQNLSFNVKIMLGFFTQRNIKIWLFILIFYFNFISSVWIYIKPYLVANGVSADSAAFYVGVYGSVIGAIFGILAVKINPRFSNRQILLGFCTLNALSVAVLLYAQLCGLDKISMLLGVTMSAAAIAFSSSVINALTMEFARRDFAASDYAFSSSIAALGRIAFAAISGVLIAKFGYLGMFVFELCGIVMVFFVLFFSKRV